MYEGALSGVHVPAPAPSLSRTRRGLGRAALLVFLTAAATLYGGLGASPASAADQAPVGGQPIGDFNGDGFGDFAVRIGEAPHSAAVAFGSAGPGVVQLPGAGGTGVSLGLDKTAVRVAYPPAELALPVRAGDVDGDGFDDIIQPGQANRSYVVYGAPGAGVIDVGTPGPRVTALLHDYATGHDTPSLFPLGQQVYGVGDFNGDGFDDWIQSRYATTVFQPAQPANNGGGVVVLGGPRVPELETRGTGARRIQIDTSRKCQTIWRIVIPSTQCWLIPIDLAAIGDYNRDGKTDLHSRSSNGFVIPGRASLANIHALQLRSDSIPETVRPTTTPWTAGPIGPGPIDPGPVDPGSVGTAGWTLDSIAFRTEDGGVNLAHKGIASASGAIYDTSKLIDANELVVDFDLQLVDGGGYFGNGNGATLAFASRSQGGFPRAANYGLGLGWVGNKGNAIMFGTVKGTYTPSDNYVAIAAGGVGKSGYPVFVQTAPAVSRLRNATNHVTFRATGGVVTVSINGVERLRRAMTLPTDAYLGFTAGTSAASQDHIVRNVVVKKP